MVQQRSAYEPRLLEKEARTVWKARKLPPPGGIFGPPDGSVVHQFEGSFTSQDAVNLVAQRAVEADVDARYLALTGRRAVGTLRRVKALAAETEPVLETVLERLGVWTGGNGPVPWDSEDRARGVQTMVGRLAHRGVLVSRDLPLRVCPTCVAPRSPERIIYQEADGETYLVRFDLPWNDQVVHALVWVDAPWRLLGTSAILLHPEIPYVVARYRRKDVEELILTSRSSVDRFRSWIPGASLEVIEEHPGRFFEGRPYTYPLRVEFPTGGTLSPPAGTVISVNDVTDTGTGIVPLVPGHGSTDATIADAKGVAGWPLINPKGQLDLTLMHKYAGLDLRTGDDFIVRDLTDNGAIFARLRVRRGVPHCAVCGSSLLWMPGRAWCLEPGRLPADRIELYRRLLPNAPQLGRVEVAPWPVSEATRSSEAGTVALLECSQCERLEALDGPVACSCGGKRYPVGRRLLPSATGVLSAWARQDPIPATDSVRLYVGERRRVPVVVHHLMAMSGLDGTVGEVGIALLPTVDDADLASLMETHGADAVRAALVRASRADRSSGTIADRSAQEEGRLARYWSMVRALSALGDSATFGAFTQPIGGFLGELEVEDRALLARFERTRIRSLADYDHREPASALKRVFRFIETDLSDYWELVRARLDLKGMPLSKGSALRTLTHVLRGCSEVLGPILPHLSEAVHRRLSTGAVSLFEGTLAGADSSLLSDELCAAWDRWHSLLVAVRRFRHRNGLPPGVALPSAALLLSADDQGDRFRTDRAVLERLLGIARIDVGSPREPWSGRQRQLRPVESEIQRYYPSQATQILHLLQRMPVRKAPEAGADAELSVVIQGLPRRVFPSMIEYSEVLPPRMVPCPWSLGELYLELPEGVQPPNRVPPPLSPDALWIVRRLDRRLRAVPRDPNGPLRVAILSISEPLATELRAVSEPLARYLGLQEVRVLENPAAAPPRERMTGRTHAGAGWWVHVPGLPLPSRAAKRRPARPRGRRIPSTLAVQKTPEVDYSSEEMVARGEAVRALGLELDELLGAPLLGPAKVSRAWDQGFTSVAEYRTAAFETLEELPGFGRNIAGALVVKLGGTIPPPPPRPARTEPRRLRPPDGYPAEVATPWPAPSVPEETHVAAPIEPTPGTPVRRPLPALPSSQVRELAPQPVPISALPEPLAEPAGPPEPLLETEGSGGPEPPPSAEEPPAVEVPTRESSSPEPVSPGEPSPVEERPPLIEGTAPPGELPPSTDVGQAPSPSGEPSRAVSPEASEAAPLAEREGVELTGEAPPAVEPAAVPPTVEPPEGVGFVPLEAPPPVPAVEAEAATAASPTLESLPRESTTPGPETQGPATESPPPPEQGAIEPTELTAPLAEGGTLPNGEPLVPSEPTPPVAPPPEALPTVSEAAPATEASDIEAILPHPPQVVPVVEPAITVPPGVAPSALTSKPAGTMPEAGTLLPPRSEEVAPEPVPPPPVPTPSGIELDVGASILSSLQPFLDATAAGHRGVCVVRQSPERIAAQAGSRPVEVYWLTNLGRGKTLKPNDLPGLLAFLARSIEEEHVMAFYMEGIEYLVRIHGAEALLARLVEVDRLAREHDVRVWVHVTADLLSPAELDLIVGTFGAKTAAQENRLTG